MPNKKLIVPVSGGKDSQVVLSLALKTGRDIICVHQNTQFDHPATYDQLKKMESFYKVTIEHTESEGMINFLKRSGYFPNSSARGCTSTLKQKPFSDWLVKNNFNGDNAEIWFGMRSDESKDRSTKYGGLRDDDVFYLSELSSFYGRNKKIRETIGKIQIKLPIVNWTTLDVFAHLKTEGAPLNELYAKGHTRVGCYPCLLARKDEWKAAAADPYGRQHIEEMISLENQWKAEKNPRKFIKVHRTWDVRDFLNGNDVGDSGESECGFCSI